MEINKKIFIIMISILVISGGVYFMMNNKSEISEISSNISSSDNNSEVMQVTMYKSPTCGCCVHHASYIEKDGYDVEVVKQSDMASIKNKYNIPYDMESCHTAIYGDYFVEGHMPIEAIDKLLTERPDIDGISLPGMPAGSPGMPGTKTGAFTIYALKDGQSTVFMTL